MTAFVVSEDGTPSVECWEIHNLVPESKVVTRKDGSKATVSQRTMSAELEGLDILTWPSFSPIWPPPAGEMHNNAIDFGDSAK